MNPAVMIATRYIGKARKRSRVLTPQQIRLYLHTIYQSNIRRQFKLAPHILLLTLSRKSELLQARWEDVDFGAGDWLIPEENAKTGKPHIVYLSTRVAAMFQELETLAGESELVLPGRSSVTKLFAANALNKPWRGLLRHGPAHHPRSAAQRRACVTESAVPVRRRLFFCLVELCPSLWRILSWQSG
jgi:integrase